MKKLLLTLVACACLTVSGAAQTLKLRADAWMPINGDPASDRPGYAIEIARAVFEPAGIKVDYQIMSWTDALKASRAGEIDGVIGANRTEGQGLLLPQEEISNPVMCLLTLPKSAWTFQNAASLSGRRIGCIESYSYWEFLDQFIKTHPQQTTIFKGDDPLKDGIEHLLQGKIDVLPEALPVFAWKVKQLGQPMSAFRIAYTQPGDPAFIALSPKTPGAKEKIALIDAGIRRLRASGELKKILERYGVGDWK